MDIRELLEEPKAWGLVAAKATQILHKMSWSHDLNLAGVEAHDLISKYIYRCLKPGDKFWNRKKYPDPSGIIARSAFRDVLDYYKSQKYKTTRNIGADRTIEEVGDQSQSHIDGMINDDFIEKITGKIDDNENMYIVLSTMKAGHTETKEIAQELGINPNKVSKIRAQIKDRIKNLYKEWRS